MGAGHERYEELAVGHVLGGLDPVDAADFRSHLVRCRDCRLRVAELRDLASDLAAAEREERTAAQLKTEVVRRDAPPEPQPSSGWRLTTPFVVVAGIAILAIFLGLAFWNAHLRESRRQLLQANERGEETLSLLAEGRSVDPTMAQGVSGLVATDRDAVAMTLSGLPAMAPDDVVAVWLRGGERGDRLVRSPIDARAVPDRRLALSAPRQGATDLLVTLQERGTVGAPAGRELLSASLEPAPVGVTS